MSGGYTTEQLTIEGAKLIFKNFAGEQRQFNEKGKRVFSVYIDDETFAQHLINLGWRLKKLKCVDDVCLFDTYHLPVKINFASSYPPRIYLIKQGARIPLTEETVGMLDSVPIASADVVLSPYHWEGDTNPGVKAYLAVLYATLDETELDLKYSDLPETTG